MRDSFIFYKSFYDSIKELDPTDQVQIYNAIFEYQFNGKEIKLNGVCKSIFALIIPLLKVNNKRYENGKKGGRPKNQIETKEKPKNNQIKTKEEPNVLCIMNNELCNKEKRIIEKRKIFTKPTIEEIEEYCKERNNGINANAFFDFYESKDWYVGKNKMKDWKACIRTWEKRNGVVKNEPVWLNKEMQQEIASYEEQKEMEELLKDYGR